MGKNRFIDDLTSGRMTRREFKKALAATGLGLVTVPFISKAGIAAGEEHPLVFTWSGYEEEGFIQTYVDNFGEAPNYSFFGDEEEAFAKIRAGFRPDVSMPCSYKIPKWHAAEILAPIDEARLSTWPDVIPQLKERPEALYDGKRFWLCMDWAQTSIVYRTDLVDPKYEAEPTWGLLWDPQYEGRLAMIDSLIDGVMVAAIYADAADPFDMTPEEVAKTKELLREQRPLLRFYSNDMTTIQQALASGELVAGVTWNDSYMALRDQGLPVAWMKPGEGAMTWTCGIALMAEADPEKVDRSYEFIDAMLSPEAGVYEITEWGYGHANMRAFEQINEDDLRERGLPGNPKEIEAFLSSGIFQAPIQNEPELQQMFEEVKAGF